MSPSDQAQTFEAHRTALTGLAYRMLGSRADAEDVVQDAYLRWHEVDHAGIEEPRRHLGTIVTRLCLDRMKSGRRGGKSISGRGCRSRWSTRPWTPAGAAKSRTTFRLR